MDTKVKRNMILGMLLSVLFILSCSPQNNEVESSQICEAESYEAFIDKMLRNSSFMPRIEIAYSDSVADIAWQITTVSDSIICKKFRLRDSAEIGSWAAPIYAQTKVNIRQLLASVNGKTIPYYYGDLVECDPNLSIKVESFEILCDKDFSHSIVPAEIIQLYRYMAVLCHEICEGESDMPPYVYGDLGAGQIFTVQ